MLTELYQKKICSRDTTSVRKLTHSAHHVNLDFSSNDYLGLSANADIFHAAVTAAQIHGVGSTGSRLLSGNKELFMEFEAEIARCKSTEAALIFSSGFQCNSSVLSSLLDHKTLHSRPLVFFDRLNHASLYQAVFLSGAQLIRYRHNDADHLESLLSTYAQDERPKCIVTETVFGMDGDKAPLQRITAMAKKYDALLYLDEAHAMGVVGKNGYGMSTEVDFTGVTVVIMGTFSKALGGSGAYVACSRTLVEYIVNFCPGFIYSTAPSPFVIGAAQWGWNLLPRLGEQRRILEKNSTYLRGNLKALGFDVGHSVTHIIPIVFGKEEEAKRMAERLLQHHIKVSCVLPPTVPPGTARIRIALGIHHTQNDMDTLIKALQCIKKE